MAVQARDDEREERIRMEIIVDAYGPEVQATCWYVYLQEQLQFPVLTGCIAERAISPLRLGDAVEVIDLAPEEGCEHEMFVMMRWERRGLAVPLSQLEALAMLMSKHSRPLRTGTIGSNVGIGLADRSMPLLAHTDCS